MKPAVFQQKTARTSFIEKGSPSGHQQYLPHLSSQLNLSHLQCQRLLSESFSTCIILTGRGEWWIRLLFFSPDPYNPAKLLHQSAEPFKPVRPRFRLL